MSWPFMAAPGLAQRPLPQAFIHPVMARDWWLGGPHDVHVMPKVGGPSVPLIDWIRQHYPELLKKP